MHIVNDKKPGRLVIVMAGAKGISGKDLVIMDLLFEAILSPEKKITTKFRILELQLMSETLKPIKANIKFQPITIVPVNKQ
jgi:hypothetical protein